MSRRILKTAAISSILMGLVMFPLTARSDDPSPTIDGTVQAISGNNELTIEATSGEAIKVFLWGLHWDATTEVDNAILGKLIHCVVLSTEPPIQVDCFFQERGRLGAVRYEASLFETMPMFLNVSRSCAEHLPTTFIASTEAARYSYSCFGTDAPKKSILGPPPSQY